MPMAGPELAGALSAMQAAYFLPALRLLLVDSRKGNGLSSYGVSLGRKIEALRSSLQNSEDAICWFCFW